MNKWQKLHSQFKMQYKVGKPRVTDPNFNFFTTKCNTQDML